MIVSKTTYHFMPGNFTKLARTYLFIVYKINNITISK